MQRMCVGWFRLQYPAVGKLLFAVPNGAGDGTYIDNGMGET